jgi:hypothetical protein
MVDLFTSSCEQRPQQVRLVRYEDLVSDPERSLSLCCEFVGLPYHTAMLDPRRWSGKGPREYERGRIVAGPPKWRAEAEKDLERIRTIEGLCFPAAERVGYVREFGS